MAPLGAAIDSRSFKTRTINVFFEWKKCVECAAHSSDPYSEFMPDIEYVHIFTQLSHVFNRWWFCYLNVMFVVYYKCIVLQNAWTDGNAAAIPSACLNTRSTCHFSSSEPLDRFQIKQRCYIPTWHACLSLQPPQHPPAGSDSRDWYLPFTPQYLCTNAFCKEWEEGQGHGLCSACEEVLIQTWNLNVKWL